MIAAKVANVLALRLPPAAGRADRGVRRLGGRDRRGRARAPARRACSTCRAWASCPRSTAGVEASSGEILVFTDADSMFEPGTLRRLVSNFADERSAAVAANVVRFVEEDGRPVARGEGLYWRYERLLKRLEDRVGSVVSASGHLYAVRRGLLHAVGADRGHGRLPDLERGRQAGRAARLRRAGRRARRHARRGRHRAAPQGARDEPGAALGARARRRRCCRRAPACTRFEVIFHKLLRRFVGFFLIALLASSAVLAAADPSWWLVARAAARLLRARGGGWPARPHALGPPQAALDPVLLLPGQRGGRAGRALAVGRRSLRALGARRRARRCGEGLMPVALPTASRRRLTRVAESGAGACCLRPTSPGGGWCSATTRSTPEPSYLGSAPEPVRRAPRLARGALPGGAARRARGRTAPSRRPVRGDHVRRRLRRQPHPRAAAAAQRRRMAASFFVAVGFLERDDEVMAHLAEIWSTPREQLRPLSWSQVAELRAAGMAIGSHTWSHRNLAHLSPDAAEVDLRRSREVLEQRLGEPVRDDRLPVGEARPPRERRHVRGGAAGRVRAGPDLAAARAARSTTTRCGSRGWGSAPTRSSASRPRSRARSTGTPTCTSDIPAPLRAPDLRRGRECLVPRVDAIITCHNYGRFLGEAIESVLAQSHANVDVVVVDDGSTDETRAVAARYAGRGVRYVNRPARRRRPGAQRGARGHLGSAGGLPRRRRRLAAAPVAVGVTHLERHPEAALVAAHAFACDERHAPLDHRPRPARAGVWPRLRRAPDP